jgi:hypothetical protein
MSDNFLEKIEVMIRDMNHELSKVREARLDPSHHCAYVSEKINDIIKKGANSNPDEPVRTLGSALSSVEKLIRESFENTANIEKNIIVTINAYIRVKEAFISHVNELKQREDLVLKSAEINAEAGEEERSRVRKIGTRPVDKIASRRKKKKETPEKKPPAKRKKKSKNT